MHVCSYGRGPNPQPFRQKIGQPAACRRPNSESALAHSSANSIGPREVFGLQDPKAVGGGRPSAVLMLASSPTRGSHCAGLVLEPYLVQYIDLGEIFLADGPVQPADDFVVLPAVSDAPSVSYRGRAPMHRLGRPGYGVLAGRLPLLPLANRASPTIFRSRKGRACFFSAISVFF